MPNVVDASNLVEFTTTGKVAAFKPPEAPKVDAPAVPKETNTAPAVLARDDAGKFTKQNDGAKSETAAAPSTKKEISDDDLPEVVRQKIGVKHRQMKEAEEFARSEALRALAAERRAEQLQKDLEAERQKSRPAPATEAPKEPQPDDFKTVAEYSRALAKFWAAEELAAERAKQAAEAAEREKEARQREFGKRVHAAASKHDDFEEVMASIKGTELEHIQLDVAEYIQESEQGPELAYHLAKNPDVLDRLRKLSPRKAVAELGKLEAKWEEKAPPAKEETPTLSEVATTARPVSKAPAPIAPLDTAGIAPVAKKPEDMSVAELREFRRNQERDKARRA